MSIRLARARAACLLVTIVGIAGCSGTTIDLARTIKVGNLTTGWFDQGVVDGKNKLVPSASFTVTNTGKATLSGLQILSVFRFLGDAEELGSSFLVLQGPDALAASATSKPLTVRANWGFTSEQPRAQMLMHKLFQDAQVEIFVKYGPAPYVKLTKAKVQRQLLTQ